MFSTKLNTTTTVATKNPKHDNVQVNVIVVVTTQPSTRATCS